jgi:hypothetical protein
VSDEVEVEPEPLVEEPEHVHQYRRVYLHQRGWIVGECECGQADVLDPPGTRPPGYA